MLRRVLANHDSGRSQGTPSRVLSRLQLPAIRLQGRPACPPGPLPHLCDTGCPTIAQNVCHHWPVHATRNATARWYWTGQAIRTLLDSVRHLRATCDPEALCVARRPVVGQTPGFGVGLAVSPAPCSVPSLAQAARLRAMFEAAGRRLSED